MKTPKWTVLIDVITLDYTSLVRLFYDSDSSAERAYRKYGGTKRPFDKSDRPSLRDYSPDESIEGKLEGQHNAYL